MFSAALKVWIRSGTRRPSAVPLLGRWPTTVSRGGGSETTLGVFLDDLNPHNEDEAPGRCVTVRGRLVVERRWTKVLTGGVARWSFSPPGVQTEDTGFCDVHRVVQEVTASLPFQTRSDVSPHPYTGSRRGGPRGAASFVLRVTVDTVTARVRVFDLSEKFLSFSARKATVFLFW